jgi:hypothetical protein
MIFAKSGLRAAWHEVAARVMHSKYRLLMLLWVLAV